jgi:hypothetical protein
VVYTHFALFGDRAAVEAMRHGVPPHPLAPGVFILQFPANPQTDIRMQNYIHGSSMYRRSAYNQAGGYRRDGLPEDQSTFARMLDQGWKARLWDAPSLEYRQHSKDQINQLKTYEMENTYLRKECVRLQDQVNIFKDQVNIFKDQVITLNHQIFEQESTLQSIYQSRSWRYGSRLEKIIGSTFPAGSWRLRWLKGMYFLMRRAAEMTQSKNTQKDEAILLASDLFDVSWYQKQNPDVVRSGMKPGRHYLLYGGFEGRDPGPRFSSQDYFLSYPDVKEAGMNPLVHYLRTGMKEGRLIQPSKLSHDR